MICKSVGLWRGRCPRTPGPPSEMEATGHLLARAGRALLRNLRGGKGSLRSALWADPCHPGEPGVAQKVPDRGDDLTPCTMRAGLGSQPGPPAVTPGQAHTTPTWDQAGGRGDLDALESSRSRQQEGARAEGRFRVAVWGCSSPPCGTVQGGTDQGRWSSLNRSERPRPEPLTRPSAQRHDLMIPDRKPGLGPWP
jgi:hypothetical protein